jgi:hypothetical protein
MMPSPDAPPWGPIEGTEWGGLFATLADYTAIVGDTCYLCGECGADTREHVVSKAFYVPPLPSDMITLPAHLACNQSTSKDEEWLSMVWSTSRPEPRGNQDRWDKAIRGLKRERSARLKAAFLGSMTELPSGWAKVEIDEPRIYYVIAKIVKGLVYNEDGVLLCDRRWWIRTITLERMVRLPLPKSRQVHDVAFLKWGEIPGSKVPSIFWSLAMYNGHIYVGCAVSPEDVGEVPHSESAQELPWPRPDPTA